jgi:hypothetical protein
MANNVPGSRPREMTTRKAAYKKHHYYMLSIPDRIIYTKIREKYNAFLVVPRTLCGLLVVKEGLSAG